MRLIISILFLFIGVLYSNAQDKVFLRNGGLIRGTVAPANTLSDTLVLINVSGSEVVIPVRLVEEIRFKKRWYGKPDRYKNFLYTQGFYKTVRAGVLLGNHTFFDGPQASPMIEALYEYHYHPLVNVGLGVGYNSYQNYGAIPLYLQYQVLFSKKQKSLFAYGQAGYGFLHKKGNNNDNEDVTSFKNGKILGAGLGLQKRLGENNYIRYQVGYQGQQVIEEVLSGWWDWGWTMPAGNKVTRKRTMNRVVFSVAYSF